MRLRGPIFISCLDTTTQTFASANTEQPMTLNTEVAGSGIKSLDNGEFEILTDGVYDMNIFPILTKTNPQTMSHFLWLQIDRGAGFVDVPDSNSETVLYQSETNDIKTITFISGVVFKAGHKFRFMNSVTDNNITLVTKNPPAGNGPRIPSIIMFVAKLATR